MVPPIYNQNWSPEVQTLYQHDMEQFWDRTLSVHQWNQYQNLSNTYFRLIEKERSLRILDEGCAQGTLALLLAERGHTLTAIDIRQEFIDYAKTRYEKGDITFIQANALELRGEDEYDLIFANQIIKHVVYPLQLIPGLKKMLAPNGRLVMSTPNWAYVKNTLPCFDDLGEPKDWEHRQFTADGDGHFFAYKAEEMTRLFKQAQFKQVNVSMYETPLMSGHMKVRYLHKWVSYKILRLLERCVQNMPFIKSKISHQLLVIGVS